MPSSPRYLRSHKAPAAKWLWLFLCTGGALWSLLRFFRGDVAAGLLLLPLLYWLGPSTMMHDGGHFSLSRRPWVNRLCALTGGAHM